MSNVAPVRECPKGARKAKLDDKRSLWISFFLQIFVKTAFLVTLNFDPKSALNLKTK